MDSRYIVALEIGSSKIKGMAAAVGELGDIKPLAVEEVRVCDCVRYGKIKNIQEVSSHVNDIIRKLENNSAVYPRKITDIFLSLGGRSLATVIAQAQMRFPAAVEITADTVEHLKKDASFGLVTNKESLMMLPYAYYIDNSEVKNIVGTIGTHLRAEFSAIVVSPDLRGNLERIKFDDRLFSRHYVVRPTALADLVLNASERQLGCALVDFGAETTTIVIYKDNILKSIVTLPIGSRNITRDLMFGLNMTEDGAETAKARSGSAVLGDAPEAVDVELNNYISARAGEIVANILHQIEAAGFKPQMLPAGIILTGGGSRLRSFDKLVEAQSKMPVRVAAIDSSTQFKGTAVDRNDNIDLLAIVKYAADKTDVSCLTQVVEEIVEPEIQPEQEAVQSESFSNRRPSPVDEDSLLEDDSDIEDDEPVTQGKNVRVRNNRKESIPNYDDQESNDYSDPTPSAFEKIKQRIANFWSDKSDMDDDLDEPAE